jgi:hypothetical protein
VFKELDYVEINWHLSGSGSCVTADFGMQAVLNLVSKYSYLASYL